MTDASSDTASKSKTKKFKPNPKLAPGMLEGTCDYIIQTFELNGLQLVDETLHAWLVEHKIIRKSKHYRVLDFMQVCGHLRKHHGQTQLTGVFNDQPEE